MRLLCLFLAIVAVSNAQFWGDGDLDLGKDILCKVKCKIGETCKRNAGGFGLTYECVKSNSEGGCICTHEYAPVCGSDGKTYGNKCQAACGGVVPFRDGACTAPSTKAPPVTKKTLAPSTKAPPVTTTAAGSKRCGADSDCEDGFYCRGGIGWNRGSCTKKSATTTEKTLAPSTKAPPVTTTAAGSKRCGADSECEDGFYCRGDIGVFNRKGYCTKKSATTTVNPSLKCGVDSHCEDGFVCFGDSIWSTKRNGVCKKRATQHCNDFKYGKGQPSTCACLETEEKTRLKGLFGTSIGGSYWVCKPLPKRRCKADAECDEGESCLPPNISGPSVVLNALPKYCLEDADECDLLNDGKGCANNEICKKKTIGFGGGMSGVADAIKCLGDNKNDKAACFQCVRAADALTTTNAPAVTTTKSAVVAKSCNAYKLGAGQTDACTCTDAEEKVKIKGRGGLFVFAYQTYWVCKALPPQTCTSDDECKAANMACLPRKIKSSSVFGITITTYSKDKYCVEDEDECDSLNRGRGCAKGQLCQKKYKTSVSFKACEVAAIATGADVGTCYQCVNPATDTSKTTTAAPDSTRTCDQYPKGLGQPKTCLCKVGTKKSLVKGRFGSFLSFSDSYFECKAVEGQLSCKNDADCETGASCVAEKGGSNFLGGLFGGAASKQICVDDEDECDFANNGEGCLMGQTCGRLGFTDYARCIAKGLGDSSKCFECKGAAKTTTATPTGGGNDDDDQDGGDGGATTLSCNAFKYGIDRRGSKQTDDCTCTENEEKVKTKGFLGSSIVGAYWICRKLPEGTCQVDGDCGEDESCLPRQTNALSGFWGDLTGKDVPKYCLEDVDECDFMNGGKGCDEGQICRKKKGKGVPWFDGGMQAVNCILKKQDDCFECVAAPTTGVKTTQSTPSTMTKPTTKPKPTTNPSKDECDLKTGCPGRCQQCVSGKSGYNVCLATPCMTPPTPTAPPAPWTTTKPSKDECDLKTGCPGRCQQCVSGRSGYNVCLATPCAPPSSTSTSTVPVVVPTDQPGGGCGGGCPQIKCGRGYTSFTPKGACCPKCALADNEGGNTTEAPASSTTYNSAQFAADIAAVKLAELNAKLVAAQTALSQLKTEMAAAMASGATTDEIETAQGKVNAAEVVVASASSAVQQAETNGNADPVVEGGNSGVLIGVLVTLLVLVLAVVAVLLMKRNKGAQNPIGATAAAINNNPTYEAHTVEQAGGLYAIPMEAVNGVENPMYASMA